MTGGSNNNNGARDKSIALVVNSLGTAGAEIQVAELAVRLRGRGWQVGVITLLSANRELVRLERLDIPHECLNMRRGLGNPSAVWRLARIIRRWNPAVLHSHMVHSNLLARVTRLIAPIPVLVTTAHNVNEGARWRYIAYRLTSGLSDLVTIISEAGARQHLAMRATPSTKLRVVPNGVDLSRFRVDELARAALRENEKLRDRFVWLAVGRFEEKKDYPNLLEAFAAVVRQQPCALLRVAGEGPLRETMQTLAARLSLSDRVQFLGVRQDVAELMNSSDAFVMSSAWEGMPLVLLEAAASGLPIVATDVGGNGEVIQGGKGGLLVPARDAAALSRGMVALMTMPPEVRAAMGRLGRQYVEQNFGMEHIVSVWESVYEGLIARRVG